MKEFCQWFAARYKPFEDNATRLSTPLEAAAHRAWSALSLCVDEIHVPDRNCSCHISPPCNDCVNHSSARAALEDAHDAIAALDKALAL